MKHLILLLATVALAGCAIDDGPVSLDNASSPIGSALAAAQKNPSAPVSTVVPQLKAAQKAIAQDQAKENQQAKRLTYETKVAASKVQWFIFALYLGALVAYIGEWLKLGNIYTAWLPDVVAGAITLTGFAIVAFLVLSFWVDFGWLLTFF